MTQEEIINEFMDQASLALRANIDGVNFIPNIEEEWDGQEAIVLHHEDDNPEQLRIIPNLDSLVHVNENTWEFTDTLGETVTMTFEMSHFESPYSENEDTDVSSHTVITNLLNQSFYENGVTGVSRLLRLSVLHFAYDALKSESDSLSDSEPTEEDIDSFVKSLLESVMQDDYEETKEV